MNVVLRPDGTIIPEKAPDGSQDDPDRQNETTEVVL
jgi:hypothetical protein